MADEPDSVHYPVTVMVRHAGGASRLAGSHSILFWQFRRGETLSLSTDAGQRLFRIDQVEENRRPAGPTENIIYGSFAEP